MHEWQRTKPLAAGVRAATCYPGCFAATSAEAECLPLPGRTAAATYASQAQTMEAVAER